MGQDVKPFWIAVLPLKTTDNVAYYSYMAGLWTLPELAAGIIAACLPSCPKFFQRFWQKEVVSTWRCSLQNLLIKRSDLSHWRRRRGGGLSGDSSLVDMESERTMIDKHQ
ncbi:hypothetical protein AbraIFM66950_007027 [Aspergillus brasiliensis]|nr:hypothetical protein AbraIFM66950_007027 [Aspergillus brasiliensis]